MSGYQVVITDCEYESIENERAILSEIGAQIHSYQLKNEDDIIEVSKNCDALIFQYANISKKIIANLNKCKIIAKYATGLDNIDIEAATKKGICFTNVGSYCTEEVSTHAMALLLNLARKVKLLDCNSTQGNWSYKAAYPLYSLRDSIVGIIGLGKISSDLTRKLSNFCNEIWVYSNSANEEIVESLGAKKKTFEEIINHADFISIHSPLNETNKYMFNKEIFKAMKNTSSIVNVGRGALINENDLIWALENREISGAALDVLLKEPPDKSNPLLSMNNVIITPHAAWYSVRSQLELQRTTALNVKRVLEGYFPENLVNAELKHILPLKAL